ncbi:MAG: AAA family ATPase [Acidimicrobiales bacterium]
MDPGLTQATEVGRGLLANLNAVVRGKPEANRLAVLALLSGGHLLIEDVPGVGKTLLAKALARSVDGIFRRIQGTPDLLPAELTGVNVLGGDRGAWEFRPGPLFAHVVLVDEINRATPRTQSALLEAMEERTASVDGHTHALPEPFFLVATQNPFDHAGTFLLLEGQRDRFAVVARLGPPDPSDERDLLLGVGGLEALAKIHPVVDPPGLVAAMAAVAGVHCSSAVADYVVALVTATRRHPRVTTGASPRAGLSLLALARAVAAMEGRRYVLPEDVQAVAGPGLGHRLVLPGGPELAAGTDVVAEVVASVAVPPLTER